MCPKQKYPMPLCKLWSVYTVFIGPEGGFSSDEIALAGENGITSVTLGKRILRTETAGLVTSVILLYELEE